ncbi:probable G-protein coupled receptor 139 isoform X2 [Pseudomyrmex gracilis]|uniref:probable G-protein coupled receptor 139 isoform X2 n=1 Tax=Pseudomyrmex gracilis TaxID=219809 RepID=UPI000994E3FB|nr:probable G-protein coupled receptor 139 isoform X2 [Pseudomyrmex gracilis]
MILLRDRNIRALILVAIMLSQPVNSNVIFPTSTSRTKCPPVTVLDFIHNSTQPELENKWPCEVRSYWLSLQPFVKFVRFLLRYVTPFIIALGVLLNTVSFSMLSTPVLCDSNLSLYLSALAISDNGALIFNYAVSVAKSHSTFVNDLFMNNKFLCGMSSVCMELFQFTSTWLIVALTWTRVIAIVFPFGARGCQNCSAVIIITLACISFTISLTKLYSGGYETDSVFEFVPCQEKIKPWGSAMYFYIALSTWLPLLFISIGNVLLIIRMRKSYKIHNELTHNFRYKRKKPHSSSRTLLAVSIVHLILMLPLGIVETLGLYWDVILISYPAGEENKQYIHWMQEKMFLKWCRGLFFHIYHWNFAINFFLYCLTGKKFRRVVTRALKNFANSYLLCHKDILNCSNCHKHLAVIRSFGVLLARTILRNKEFIDNNITRNNVDERNDNVT